MALTSLVFSLVYWSRSLNYQGFPSQTRLPMPRSRFPLLLPYLLVAVSCTSTTTAQLIPAPQTPVCAASETAMVFWRPEWRPDQKDILAREAAATDGFRRFFETSGCFKTVSLERLPPATSAVVEATAIKATERNEKVVVISVKELGPTVKIGASLALVEGGTEVVLEISEFKPQKTTPRTFAVQWRSGGPGIVKGVASLPQDFQAALAAGLQPQ